MLIGSEFDDKQSADSRDPGTQSQKAFAWNDSLVAEFVANNPQTVTRLSLSNSLISDTGLLNIAKNVPLLQILDLGSTNITDISISAITKRCRHLRDLDISKCRLLTDHAMTSIIGNCRQLRTLKINDCQNFTDWSLMNLRYLKDLSHLEMDHVSQATDNSLIHVIRFCNLKYLSVQDCPLVGDQSIGKLSSLNRAWHGVQHLLIGNSDITDEALVRIALTCHELQTLDVTNCGVISDVSVLEMARGLPRLRSMSVQGCPRISDAAFIVLISQLQFLQTFNAGNCDQLTNASLLALAHHAKQLRHVNIQGCVRVTNRGVHELLNRASKLQTLILCGCLLITDDALLFPSDGQNLSCLTLLDIRMCHLITFSAIRYLRRHFSRILVVNTS